MTDYRMPLIIKQNDAIIRLLSGEHQMDVMKDYLSPDNLTEPLTIQCISINSLNTTIFNCT